ncbi:MAG: GGDEF and EAL domain-containing protein [Lachnospiraceae bacterium]|nr:GGDEF and EAL domain-containing protein [Lachnospiraceae bacterium]
MVAKEFYDTGYGGRMPAGLPGGFFVYEAAGDEKIVYAGPNVVKLYGCDSFEDFLDYTHGTFEGMVDPEDYHRIQNQIQAQTLFGEKRHDYVRYRIITKQGEIRYIEDFGHLLHSENGRSYFFVFIVDVDQNEFLNHNRNSLAEAEILSSNNEIDELTGLFNMSFFYHKTQMILSSPEGRRQDVSFIHFDIPNFKLYNERNGFRLGDELLRDFSKVIRDAFQGSTIARFSDDHFVVCAVGDRKDIINRVETVYKNMLLSEDTSKKVRIKAGIYYLDDRRAEVGLACDHARLACNSIKGRHDVNYCVYDEMLRENMRKQQYVVDHIDEAIEKEYIKVFYQPVIRVKTGQICGYEALVRWIDPNIGMLSPGDFIDTLEQFHLIHLVDKYVIKKVCQDYRMLFDAGEPMVPVSVNISRLDFELCDIFGIVEETRKEYDVPRRMIDLEITESALNDNVGYIRSECDKMRALGYHIWLDDFGSGYSSLNTIAEYNFDVLKLDLIFLRSFDHNSKTAKLMEYIVEGVKGMGLTTVCEGVESDDHYAFLKRIGCERAQGYCFGKPMPLDETRRFTRDKGMTWEDEKQTEEV